VTRAVFVALLAAWAVVAYGLLAALFMVEPEHSQTIRWLILAWLPLVLFICIPRPK